MSGVLAVVTMGVCLAATVWPMVCSRSSMENVWHTAEWFFNTVLFQLAGLIIGAAILPQLVGNLPEDAISGSGSGNVSASGSSAGRMLASVADATADLASSAQTSLTSVDLLWAVATYLACSAIRAIVVLVHFPLLRRLGYGMSLGDGMRPRARRLVVPRGVPRGRRGIACPESPNPYCHRPHSRLSSPLVWLPQ